MNRSLIIGGVVGLWLCVAACVLVVKYVHSGHELPSFDISAEAISESLQDYALSMRDRFRNYIAEQDHARFDDEQMRTFADMVEQKATEAAQIAPAADKAQAPQATAPIEPVESSTASASAPASTLDVSTTEAPLTIEAVLVPRQVTVISSSQDGQIAEILVNHGDSFKKGDLLLAYDCSELQAEADIVNMESGLAQRKAEGSSRLFKLDIISDIDRLGLEVENNQTSAKKKLYAARMRDCEIRAPFDGRVTKRLANPGEYTRTDRVLLEVASTEPLQAEFLVPSKWLRWMNIGAPVSITLNETEKTYTARVQRIYGEVDPVSQSIQMVATLDSYTDPLLPGMSGKAVLDIDAIQQSGIKGYLEGTQPPSQTH